MFEMPFILRSADIPGFVVSQWAAPNIDWTLFTNPDPILPGGEALKWRHKLRRTDELKEILVNQQFETEAELDAHLDEEVGTYQCSELLDFFPG